MVMFVQVPMLLSAAIAPAAWFDVNSVDSNVKVHIRSEGLGV